MRGSGANFKKKKKKEKKKKIWKQLYFEEPRPNEKKKEMEKRATFLFSLFALDYQIWLL